VEIFHSEKTEVLGTGFRYLNKNLNNLF